MSLFAGLDFPMKRFLAEMRITLRRVVRLGTFRRVARGAAGVRPLTLLAQFGISLSMVAITDAAWAGRNPGFEEWGIVTALAGWAIFAATIVLLGGGKSSGRLSRAMADLAGLGTIYMLLLAAMGTSVVVFTNWLNDQIIPHPGIWQTVLSLIILWMLISLWRAGSRLWSTPPRFPGARYLFAALIPILLIPQQPIVFGSNTDWTRFDVWYLARSAFDTARDAATNDDTASDVPEIDFEATLYRQPSLLDKAVSGLLPSPQGRSQIYFLGLAPSSAQDVFRKEVAGARALFDARFGTSGRSIALINSVDTIADTPLANVSNLGLALDGIGKVMNRDKDVLVLFITTHGSKEILSVSFPGFNLNQITPEQLLEAFTKSGIKNKVVIISACHSGSFIPALKGDDTLILTAASADKTSFGCSNEREWTYFGDALFNHALKDTRSFSLAFTKASEIIKGWELEQKLTASEPQISMGSSISRLLETMGSEAVMQ